MGNKKLCRTSNFFENLGVNSFTEVERRNNDYVSEFDISNRYSNKEIANIIKKNKEIKQSKIKLDLETLKFVNHIMYGIGIVVNIKNDNCEILFADKVIRMFPISLLKDEKYFNKNLYELPKDKNPNFIPSDENQEDDGYLESLLIAQLHQNRGNTVYFGKRRKKN